MLCKHAVAAIWNRNMYGGQAPVIPESLVHPVYTLDRWKSVYKFKLFPINGRIMWPKCNTPSLLIAPKIHKPVGRPKKARKKSVVEIEEGTKGGTLSKKGSIKSCRKCGKMGHNSRTCKGKEPT